MKCFAVWPQVKIMHEIVKHDFLTEMPELVLRSQSKCADNFEVELLGS